MINIPYAIKKLFEQDSISKNFRVHFPNGEYRDLVNSDMVSESVVFTESINSSNEFKFGFIEGANIRFKTYFRHNIRGLKIFCSIEIDITSCGSPFIQIYGNTSDDVPYPYFSIPYGYFIVDSCKLSENNDTREIIAYQQKFEERPDSAFIPKLELAKLIWGYSLHYPTQAVFNVTEPLKVKLNSTKFALSCFHSLDFLGEPTITYDSNSDLFTHIFNSDTHKRLNPTIKTRIFSTPFVPTPDSAGDITPHGTIYKVMVKGRVLVFGDEYYKYFDYNYLNAEVSYTKKFAQLPYLSTDYMYNLSWKNNITIPDKDDFIDPFVYEQLKDELEDLCTPCVRFCDCGTFSGAGDDFWVAHQQYAVQDGGAFPLNSTVNLKYVSGEDETIISYGGYEELDGRFVRTNNYFISDYIKHVTQSPVSNSSGYNSTLALATLNSNGYQNYIDIPVYKDKDNRYFINIDPDMLEPLNYEDTHVIEEWRTNYYDAYGDRGDPQKQLRTKHIEFCIPTEIVITKVYRAIGEDDDLNVAIDHTASRFSITYPERSFWYAPELEQTLVVNEFREPKLVAYDISDQLSIDMVFDTQYLRSSPDVISYSARVTDYVFDDDFAEHYSDASTSMYNVRSSYVFTVNNPLFKKISEFIEYVVTDSVAKEIMSGYAELNAMLLRYSRTQENVVEQIPFDDSGIELLLPADDLFPGNKIYPIRVPGLYPSDLIYPSDYLYPEDIRTQYITPSLWRKLYVDDESTLPYTKVSFTYTLADENGDTYEKKLSVDIDIEGVEIKNASELVLNNNWIIKHSSVSEEEVMAILLQMAKHLATLYYYSMSMNVRALPHFEAGDTISIIAKNHLYKTKILRHTISGIQSLIDSIENR